jgi:hypothetical protein
VEEYSGSSEQKKIYVVDSIMGSGKTESMIYMINNDPSKRYFFITPFLKEVERIKSSCPHASFVDPSNYGKGKLNSLHELISQRENIASTHALFKKYESETIKMIEDAGYILILDEVVDVIESVRIHKDDIKFMLSAGLIYVDDDGYVIWSDDAYHGDNFSQIKAMAQNKNLILIKEALMFWILPVGIFSAFQEVYVLTYMFEGQIQKYYYDINNIQYRKLGVTKHSDHYQLCEDTPRSCHVNDIKSKVHILIRIIGDTADFKLNTVLSYSWFGNCGKPDKTKIAKLKSFIKNIFRNIYKSKSEENMWTCFSENKTALSGDGYTRGFISMNARATNDFRHKKYLVYCVNRYMNPCIKNYFISHGVSVDENKYALSEMIQWIWRSAIRDGEEIHICIPSTRMRKLFEDWLEEISTAEEVSVD